MQTAQSPKPRAASAKQSSVGAHFGRFLIAAMLFLPPIVLLGNKPFLILGIPALAAYLTAAWAVVVGLAVLGNRRRAD